MMPPLPQPFDRVRRRLDPMYTSLYTEAQMLAYGRSVAEAKDAEIAALRELLKEALEELSLWMYHGHGSKTSGYGSAPLCNKIDAALKEKP